jgi:hypothetical protein
MYQDNPHWPSFESFCFVGGKFDKLAHNHALYQCTNLGGGHCRKLLIKRSHIIEVPPLMSVHDVQGVAASDSCSSISNYSSTCRQLANLLSLVQTVQGGQKSISCKSEENIKQKCDLQ